jgi:hypothetical protein
MHKHEPNVNVDVLRELGYERRDVKVAPIVRLVAWIFGLTIGSAFVTYLLLLVLAPGGRELSINAAASAARQRVPGPRLQANPSREMQDYRRDEDGRLQEYGVADAQNGTARIPIDRAMDLALQRGVLKARLAAPTE